MTTPVSPQEIEAIQLRMDAYYYGFYETGVPEIDLVLSAVACAGKAFHHTDNWTDNCDPYTGHTGANPVEWIQNAARAAASAITERDATIARIQSAAKMGMDAAGAIAYANLQRAERLHAESKPEAIDSERAANAVLTEEYERLREALAWMGLHGVQIVEDNHEVFFSVCDNDGCHSIEPPAHLRTVLEEARNTK